MTIPLPIRNYLRANQLIQHLYFDWHLADIPVLLGSKSFREKSYSLMELYLNHDELQNEALLKSIYHDIKQCYYKYKMTPQEYFLFELRNKNSEERESYLSDSMIMKYAAERNGRLIHDTELNNKYNFYTINQHFFNRDAILFNISTSAEQFTDFAIKTKRIIAKPNKSALGSGVEIFTVLSQEDAEKIFKYLRKKGKEYIIEEVISQSPEMAVWNQSSVNTIRINSFLSNGIFNILSPFMRTGRKGCIVDNGGQGGIFASIDKNTGLVMTPGMDEKGNSYDKHPDTGILYFGWQVPQWDKLLHLVEMVHRNMHKHVYVSWDFALSNNGWVLIEGNWGEFVAQQMTNKRGFKKDFITFLNAK